MNAKEPTKIIVSNQSRLTDAEALRRAADGVLYFQDLERSGIKLGRNYAPFEHKDCTVLRTRNRSHKFNSQTFTITNA